MTGLIAKLVAYAKYPRRTFFLLHPLRAAKFGLAYLAGRRLFGDPDAKKRGSKGRTSARRPSGRGSAARRRRRTVRPRP